MESIAKNEFYELSYDSAKNRVYWKMIGFWKAMSIVPDFDKDWDTAFTKVKPGWTMLADLVELRVMPEDVGKAQDEKQKVLLSKGCTKVSVLVESGMTKMSLNKSIRGSGMDAILQHFEKGQNYEAEKWLDEK